MRKLTAIATVLLVSASGSAAWAQEQTMATNEPSASDTGADTSRVEMKAPKRAFEIGVDGGYTQPFGNVGAGGSIHDLVTAGGAVGLALGYRFDPHWSIAATGQYHQSAAGHAFDDTDADIRGVAMGAQGTYHFRPYRMVDPYLTFGSGYRMLFTAPKNGPNDMIHGVELAKTLIGLDFRVSPSVAIGPLAGADLNLFLWDNPQGATGNVRLEARPSTFLFAGLGGRFDVGGDRVPHDRVAMEPVPTPAAAPPPAPPEPPPAAPPPTGIQIEQRILDICKIEGPKAFFDFDKADVKNTDQKTLDEVAECFKSGPLKGRAMKLVGRADPRGTDQYNQKLGQTRADSVSDYLTDKGVQKPEIQTESRGEQDATGTDEASWAYDRRVDLKLGD